MYIITGLPGAGKTTVLNEFVKKHNDFNVYNYGTIMFNKAKELFNINNRDEIRKFSLNDQQFLQEKVISFLLTLKGKIILDTHASVNTRFGYLPGFSYSSLNKLNIDLFVYITSDLSEIIERRKKDKTRIRDEENLERLRLQDNVNIAMLSSFAFFKNCPLKIIYNKNGMLNEAVKELENALI